MDGEDAEGACWGNEGTGLEDEIKVITPSDSQQTHAIGKLRGIGARWACGVSLVKNFGKKSVSRLSLEAGKTCGDGTRN